MDRWYRDLHMAFGRALRGSGIEDYNLTEDFRACTNTMENHYKDGS